MLDKTK